MSAGECGAVPAGSYSDVGSGKVPDLGWFKKRRLRTLMALVAIVFVAEGASLVSDFSFGYALGSVPAAIVWMLHNFCPMASSFGQLGMIATQVVSTVFDSIAATMFAALLGIVLAVLGCSSVGVENGAVRGIIRVFANIFRNVPMIAWALLLLLSFKQNELTGFLALFLATLGQITRFFLDTLDEIPSGPIEALHSCGASFWQIVFQAGLPLAVAELMSWTLYMVETNIREATLVGLLTGTGIGFVFNLYYASFRYDCAGLVILVTIVLVLMVEAISNAARRSMI